MDPPISLQVTQFRYVSMSQVLHLFVMELPVDFRRAQCSREVVSGTYKKKVSVNYWLYGFLPAADS